MAMTEHTIRIDGGHLQFVYSDDLAVLCDTGATTVVRVSHVEPYDGSGGTAFAAKHAGSWWTADMSPVDGPVLGPFKTRAEALAAERAWLTAHRGL
jgi:hypothetical protein